MRVDLSLTPLVYIDCETTGFDPKKCRMIEVAAIRVEGGEIVDQFTSLLKIDEPLPEFIVGLTGITDEMLKDGALFPDVIPQLLKILEGAVFVAHNAKFDYSFFQSEFQRAGQQFSSPILCTVDLARKVYPRMPRHKLADLIELHKFEYSERHRAHDDAAVLVQLVNKCRSEFGDDKLQRSWLAT